MSRIQLSLPDVREPEKRKLIEAVESGWIAPAGPHLAEFEQALSDLTARRGAVATSSGTAALHLILHALGVGAGDEVVVSTFTFAATANAVLYTGAAPTFVDSEATTWNMSPTLLEEHLSAGAASGRLPAAVVAVDLYGQCASYDGIDTVCETYGVPLVSDAAESIGASLGGRPAGSFGVAAALSFNGNKMITTSGGGAVVSDDQRFLDRVRFLSTQAKEDEPHYEHREVGFNYRLSNLLAAFGTGQLETLADRVACRRAHFDRYSAAFNDVPGLTMQPEPVGSHSNRWLSCLLIDPAVAGVSSTDLRVHLDHDDIEARPTWKPMHQQPLFADAPKVVDGTSDLLFASGLCLPSGSAMTVDEADRVIASVLACLGRT